MDFNLIRQENEAKIPFTTRLYQSTIDAINGVAEKEKISVGSFVRHAINNALADYAVQSKTNNTEVK